MVIMHTNDTHSQIEPYSYKGDVNVGGFLRREAAIREVRAENPNTLLLDAGDGQDGQAAIQYAEKALEGDDLQLVCRAMIGIGKAYEDGIGVEKDLEKALEWDKKASTFNGQLDIFGNDSHVVFPTLLL